MSFYTGGEKKTICKLHPRFSPLQNVCRATLSTQAIPWCSFFLSEPKHVDTVLIFEATFYFGDDADWFRASFLLALEKPLRQVLIVCQLPDSRTILLNFRQPKRFLVSQKKEKKSHLVFSIVQDLGPKTGHELSSAFSFFQVASFPRFTPVFCQDC